MKTKKPRATVAELCRMLDRSEQSLRRQIQRAGIEADTKNAYLIDDVKRALEEAAARDKRAGGEHADRKARKLDVEIEILELKRDEIKRDLIPVSEHIAAVGDLAGVLRWGAEQFAAMTATETQDARVVAIAERVRDRVLERVTERVEALKDA